MKIRLYLVLCLHTYTTMSPMFKEKFDCMTLEKSYSLAF